MMKKKVLWVILAVTASMMFAVIPVSSAEEDLAGTYRLVSSTRKLLDTGEVLDTYGKHPTGYIMYGKDNRFLVIIVRDDRPKPASIEKATP